MLKICDRCRIAVFPTVEGDCPSCRHALGENAVALEPLPRDRAAPAYDSSAEDDARALRLREERARAKTRIALGMSIAAAGVAATWLSYSSAQPGGSYIIWTGAIIVGSIMTLRGLLSAG